MDPDKLYRLKGDEPFPDPREYSKGPYGELAGGGDLSPRRLLEAYSKGIFPYYAFRFETIRWCCPLDRFVIFPEEIHVSHSMRNLIRKERYDISFNECFEGVITCCGGLRIDDPYAWLGPDIFDAYMELHRQGYAESVEVWEDDKLVGGLYGVRLGNCFFGESMFSLVPSASKLALIALASTLKGKGGFIDCQFETDHLLSMGGRHISYDEYMSVLEKNDIPKP